MNILSQIRLAAIFLAIYCIAAAADESVEVSIDTDPRNSGNKISGKPLPILEIAIHSTTEFKAYKIVDDQSLVLSGAPVMVGGWGGANHPLCVDEDVNGDDIFDVVCKFKTSDLILKDGENEVILNGKTYDGQEFVGSNSLYK